jgi:hypothetical protein
VTENAFSKIENGETESFKFPGTLSKEQREIIHDRGAVALKKVYLLRVLALIS